MARTITTYQLVKRYMCGTDTRYYGLISNTGKEVKVSEDQMSYLVGRDQVTNVTGQLYKDKVLFRGIGIEIKRLPTIQIRGLDTGAVENIKPVKPEPKPVKPEPKPVKPEPKPVKPEPKPVKPEPTSKLKKHTISNDLISRIQTVLKISINGTYNTYEDMSKLLLGYFSNYAYRLEKTNNFADLDLQPIYIHSVKGNIYYISTDIWEHTDKDYMAISKTTYDLIKYEYANLVIDKPMDIDKKQFIYTHYHELVIKMQAFSRIPQYKKLKLKFMKYNTEIFDDKIPHNMILMVGEYKPGTKFDDLEGCAGYSTTLEYGHREYPLIVFKYKSFNSVDSIDNLSRSDTCTLLHEMTHAYVDAIHGSNFENDPNNCGDKLYGMNREKYKEQCDAHGKKFGTALKMVSNKTGFSFDELFSYSVRIDYTKRDTEYTQNLSRGKVTYDNKTDEFYTQRGPISIDGVTYSKGDYRTKFEQIKEQLLNNQSYFKEYFDKKFNITLGFNINNADNKIYTIDMFNNKREYDINYLTNKGSELGLYRIHQNSSIPAVMLNRYDVISTPKAIIKKVLQDIYKDTVMN